MICFDNFSKEQSRTVDFFLLNTLFSRFGNKAWRIIFNKKICRLSFVETVLNTMLPMLIYVFPLKIKFLAINSFSCLQCEIAKKLFIHSFYNTERKGHILLMCFPCVNIQWIQKCFHFFNSFNFLLHKFLHFFCISYKRC